MKPSLGSAEGRHCRRRVRAFSGVSGSAGPGTEEGSGCARGGGVVAARDEMEVGVDSGCGLGVAGAAWFR
jgi:hypothetical protein